MKKKLLTFLKSYNLHLFLLPVFFVLHGFTEFFSLITVPKAFQLIGWYLLGTIVVHLLSKLLLKTHTKAALFSLVVMSVYFFFGASQDYLAEKFPGTLVTRYSFILPAIAILFLSTFIYLKKSGKSFEQLKLYLNLLLISLIIFDCITLSFKIHQKNKSIALLNASLPICTDCPKPDIYFIVADGYAGSNALRNFFSYDNSQFENTLKEKGFFISDSSFSNYNYTIYTMGSLMNMKMLIMPGNFYNGQKEMPIAFNAIRHNTLVKYLKKEGYEIHNNSIFEIDEHPQKVKSKLLDFEKSPITTQTFLYRLKKDLGYHLITTFGLKFLEADLESTKHIQLGSLELFDSLTRAESRLKKQRPKFIYTHIIAPHQPYFYDSTGAQIPFEKLDDPFYASKEAYISYLKFTNQKLLSMIEEVYTNTRGNAIIILVSDHGCRECLEANPDRGTAELESLMAIYLPDKNYSGFYKGVSNINLFRIILNSQFKKQLPLVKDSMVILTKEK